MHFLITSNFYVLVYQVTNPISDITRSKYRCPFSYFSETILKILREHLYILKKSMKEIDDIGKTDFVHSRRIFKVKFHLLFFNKAGEARTQKWARKENAKKARANSIQKAASTPAFNTFKDFQESLSGVNEAGRPYTDKQKFDLCWAQLLRIKTLTDSKFKHLQKKQLKPATEKSWSKVNPESFFFSVTMNTVETLL